MAKRQSDESHLSHGNGVCMKSTPLLFTSDWFPFMSQVCVWGWGGVAFIVLESYFPVVTTCNISSTPKLKPSEGLYRVVDLT